MVVPIEEQTLDDELESMEANENSDKHYHEDP
jgi:hypothetical protein